MRNKLQDGPTTRPSVRLMLIFLLAATFLFIGGALSIAGLQRLLPSFFSNESSVASPQISTATSAFEIEPYPLTGPVPWSGLSDRVRSEFTLGGQVAVRHMLLQVNSWIKEGDPITFPVASDDPMLDWGNSKLGVFVNKVKRKEVDRLSPYGPDAAGLFYQALDKHPIAGRTVLVVGSRVPWVEAFCLAYDAAEVTTVDFMVPRLHGFPHLSAMSVQELEERRPRFHVVMSFSSLEHDGLGRYGDPLNPDGDLKRVKKLAGLLHPGGRLYLGVPIGNDTLYWNAHRVYGRLRFPLLTEGWKRIETFGGDLEKTFDLDAKDHVQLLHVLTPA